MKKKLLLLSFLVMPLGMSLSACKDTGEDGHTHTWGKGYSYDLNEHWLLCTGCGEKGEKAAHTFDDGAVTKEATLSEEGIKTYTCSVCGCKKKETIAKLVSDCDHDWSADFSSDNEYHWKTCSKCGELKDKSVHNWGQGVITTQPTATADGVKTFTCSACGKTNTQSVPKGSSETTEVDGYVLVDSVDDQDNLYIVSTTDGLNFNAMTAVIKSDQYPWYLNYAVTDFDLTKTGFTSLEESAEEFKFTKQTDGSYTIQTKNNNYVYSYVEDSHYSIGLCETTTAPKSGTIYWSITKENNAFVIQGTTTKVYLEQYKSFCGNKDKPDFPIYLFEKGKFTVQGGGQGGEDINVSITEDSRWNLDFTQYGYTFRDTLATLMKAKVKSSTSYSGCLSIGISAATTRSGYFVPFYHDNEYPTSDDAYNREHTWPNSRGGGKNAGGNAIEQDPYMVRPTLSKENSDRGNNFYGLGSNEWDPASCGFEAARGESARVIFYVATKYGSSHGLTLSNNPSDPASKKTMGTLKTLMEWNRKYPATTMEKQINNNLEKAGFGRNPFVDHPEYAEFIWTTNGVQTSAPTIDNGGGSGGQGGGGGQDVPPVPTYEYSLVKNLNELDGQSAFIVHDGKALTSVNGNASRPWYFNAVDADISSDKSGLNVSGAQKFTFTKVSDGVFTLKTPENKFLYSYTETGTDGKLHYSIGLKADTTEINFTIEALSDGYTIKGTNTNVYIKLGSPSFQGTSTKPTTPIYLYK